MKLRELQKNFRSLKSRESIDTQVVRNAWEKWWDAHRHPRNSAENANLAQHDAAYFSQHIVHPLRKKAIESESQFNKYKKRRGLLRLFFRIIFSCLIGYSSFCAIITFSIFFTAYFFSVRGDPGVFFPILLSLLIVVVIHYRLMLFIPIGSIVNFFIVLFIILCLIIGIVSKEDRLGFLFSFLLLTIMVILQYIIFAFLIKNISKVIARHELLEKNLLREFKGLLCSARESLAEDLKKFFQVLLELHSHLIGASDYFFLRYWNGCTSAGGVPASTEAHGLSLLSAHLSTFDVFASLFFPAGKHSRTGGRNNGLVPV